MVYDLGRQYNPQLKQVYNADGSVLYNTDLFFLSVYTCIVIYNVIILFTFIYLFFSLYCPDLFRLI